LTPLASALLQFYFPHNYLLWAAMHYVMTEQDLMLECEWVKAHTDLPNPYNDEADKLAKAGNDEDIFEFNTKFLDSTHHVINWSGIPIDMKARNFVKHIVKAKNFNNIFNSTRQQKVKQLSRQHEVSWELTQELLAVSSADAS